MLKRLVSHDVFTEGTKQNLAVNKGIKYATGVVVPVITAIASVFCAAQNMNGILNNKK